MNPSITRVIVAAVITGIIGYLIIDPLVKKFI